MFLSQLLFLAGRHLGRGVLQSFHEEPLRKMTKRISCSTAVLITALACAGTALAVCQGGGTSLCLHCPPGQQPSQPCAGLQAEVAGVVCHPCPGGSFSSKLDAEPCRPHTSCQTLGRKVATPGSESLDAVCGECLYGFTQAAMSDKSAQTPCIKLQQHVRAARSPSKSPLVAANGTAAWLDDDFVADYAVFALVPVFCLTGLLGICICKSLKKRGFKHKMEKGRRDGESGSMQKEGSSCACSSDDPNEDTIGILVRLITEKKENAAALEELLLEYENKQAPSKGLPLRLCPHQSHLHTISGLKHGCSRCAHRRWPTVLIPPHEAFKDPMKAPTPLILPSLERPLLGREFADTPDTHINVPKTNMSQEKEEAREEKDKETEGQATVLSVGRFQVAQIPEQKPVPKETEDSFSLGFGRRGCSPEGIRTASNIHPQV